MRLLILLCSLIVGTEVLAQNHITVRPTQAGSSAVASFSANAELAALCIGRERDIQLWDLASRSKEQVLRGHVGNVTSLAFAPDGKTLASGGEDAIVRIWDSSSGRQLREFKGHTKSVTKLAYSPDGETLVSASLDTSLRVWSVAEGKLVAEFRRPNFHFSSLAFAPSGQTLATACADEDIRLWDTNTWKRKGTIPCPGERHKWALRCMTFSPDGESLAMGGFGFARVIKLSNNVEQRTLFLNSRKPDKGQPSWVEIAVDLQFSADSRRLVIGVHGQTMKPFGHDETSGHVLLWDWTTEKTPERLQEGQHTVICVSLTRDGKELRSASSDGSFKMWNLGAPPDRTMLQGHEAGVTSVVFSPDGSTLVSSSDGGDGALRVWNAKTRQLEKKLDVYGRVRDVSISPDGKTVAVAKQRRYPTTVDLWDLETARIRTVLNVPSDVYATTFSPDNRFVATAGLRGHVGVWDAGTSGRPHLKLRGHSGRAVRSVAFAADGKTLASADASGNVILWDLATGAKVEFSCSADNSFRALDFSRSLGALVTCSEDVGLAFWQAKRGTRMNISSEFEITGEVASLAHSPDGRLLAVGTNDGSITVFEVATRTRHSFFAGSSDGVIDLAFSPDGKLLASASKYTCTVKLWDVAAGRTSDQAVE